MAVQRWAAAALVFLGAGCSLVVVDSITPPSVVTLRVGQRVAIRGTSWTLAFDSVVSDSRCPIDVVCVQAGEAVLAMQLSDPLFDPIEGDLPNFTVGAVPVTKYGFTIRQLKIFPPPRSNVRIDQRSYRATLKVETGSAF